MIKYPKKINKADYSENIKNPKTFYGLNPKIEFCSKCTYSNQKPTTEKEYNHKINTKKSTLTIENNVCRACKVLKEKKNTFIHLCSRKHLMMLTFILNIV